MVKEKERLGEILIIFRTYVACLDEIFDGNGCYFFQHLQRENLLGIFSYSHNVIYIVAFY